MKFWLIAVVSTLPLLNAVGALAASAEQTYIGSCKRCHDQGIGGAPKTGDNLTSLLANGLLAAGRRIGTCALSSDITRCALSH